MDRVVVVRNLDTAIRQHIAKSYRPRSGGREGLRQLAEPRAELLRSADPRLPEPLAVGGVERGEGLAAAGVENGEPVATRDGALSEPAGDRVEGADTGLREAERGSQPPGGRYPDPQAGEGAGADADRESRDRVPSPRGGGCALDLVEQASRVAGAAVGLEAEQRLVEDLAVAGGADGRVPRRRVEADEGQAISGP